MHDLREFFGYTFNKARSVAERPPVDIWETAWLDDTRPAGQGGDTVDQAIARANLRQSVQQASGRFKLFIGACAMEVLSKIYDVDLGGIPSTVAAATGLRLLAVYPDAVWQYDTLANTGAMVVIREGAPQIPILHPTNRPTRPDLG